MTEETAKEFLSLITQQVEVLRALKAFNLDQSGEQIEHEIEKAPEPYRSQIFEKMHELARESME